MAARFIRAVGEAFDADQLGWHCEDCGGSEWQCDCEQDEAPRCLHCDGILPASLHCDACDDSLISGTVVVDSDGRAHWGEAA